MDQSTQAKAVAENTQVIEECAQAARELLRHCISPWGLAASGDQGGYHNLWGRDSMITALGILADGDPELVEAVKTSLLSLAAEQTPLGLIPNKIDFGDTKRVNFRAYADGGLWFVIVATRFAQLHWEDQDVARILEAARRALAYYDYQDHDQSHLISIDEGSTWMDLFPLRGKSIYINALRYQASMELSDVLFRKGDISVSGQIAENAQLIRAAINEKLWYEPGKDIAILIQDSFSTSSYDAAGYDNLGRKLLLPEKRILKDSSYYLAYLTMRDFGEWFDTFGNLLAITSGLSDTNQHTAIFDCIENNNLAAPYPVKAMYPTLKPADSDWRYYFDFGDLNQPEQYHNGGSWPMIGGWYVAALAQVGRIQMAQAMLDTLAKANLNEVGDRFSFNEYRHGVDGAPMGMLDQAWSAGAFLLAYHSVQKTELEKAD